MSMYFMNKPVFRLCSVQGREKKIPDKPNHIPSAFGGNGNMPGTPVGKNLEAGMAGRVPAGGRA